MQTSPEGRAYIERKEGLRLHAYQDIAGVWTIGYGHTGPEVGPGVVWTKEQCDEALSERLAGEFEPSCNRVCGDVPTTQGQFDAMCSLAYNIGAEGFSRSEVAKLHRQHAYDRAADAFEQWDHVNGRVNEALHQRRVEEAQMYLDASPQPFAAPEAADASLTVNEEVDNGAQIVNGVVYTPQGSDTIGQQKALPPAVIAGLSTPVFVWLRIKHGIEFSAEELLAFFGAVSSLAVWIIPHGRK